MKTETLSFFKSIFDNLDTVSNTLTMEQIQKIIDHFGIGKLLKVHLYSSSLLDSGFRINFYLIETFKGVYFLTELPLNVSDIQDTQKKVDSKFKLVNPVYVYPETKKIHFAHVNHLYYSIRAASPLHL